jgi:hypothetical protein
MESRMGRWAAQENLIYGLIGQKYLNIFNSRSIIYPWTRVPRKDRKRSKIHQELIALTYPELMQIPVGGRPSFAVSMQMGKTVRTLARVDLSSIAEVKKMSRAEYRAHKCDKGVMKYPYFPTMFADEVYLVAIRSEYEQADIFIEADATFISALESYVIRTENEF